MTGQKLPFEVDVLDITSSEGASWIPGKVQQTKNGYLVQDAESKCIIYNAVNEQPPIQVLCGYLLHGETLAFGDNGAVVSARSADGHSFEVHYISYAEPEQAKLLFTTDRAYPIVKVRGDIFVVVVDNRMVYYVNEGQSRLIHKSDLALKGWDIAFTTNLVQIQTVIESRNKVLVTDGTEQGTMELFSDREGDSYKAYPGREGEVIGIAGARLYRANMDTGTSEEIANLSEEYTQISEVRTVGKTYYFLASREGEKHLLKINSGEAAQRVTRSAVDDVEVNHSEQVVWINNNALILSNTESTSTLFALNASNEGLDSLASTQYIERLGLVDVRADVALISLNLSVDGILYTSLCAYDPTDDLADLEVVATVRGWASYWKGNKNVYLLASDAYYRFDWAARSLSGFNDRIEGKAHHSQVYYYAGKAYLSASLSEKNGLFIFDEESQTSVFVDLQAVSAGASATKFMVTDDLVYFILVDGSRPAWLYRSNGTADGTTRVKNLLGRNASTGITGLVSDGDTLRILSTKGIYALSNGKLKRTGDKSSIRPIAYYSKETHGENIIDGLEGIYLPQTDQYHRFQCGTSPNVPVSVSYSVASDGKYAYRQTFARFYSDASLLLSTNLDDEGSCHVLSEESNLSGRNIVSGVAFVKNRLYYTFPDTMVWRVKSGVSDGQELSDIRTYKEITMVSRFMQEDSLVFFTGEDQNEHRSLYQITGGPDPLQPILPLSASELLVQVINNNGATFVVTNKRVINLRRRENVYTENGSDASIIQAVKFNGGVFIVEDYAGRLRYRAINTDRGNGPWINGTLFNTLHRNPQLIDFAVDGPHMLFADYNGVSTSSLYYFYDDEEKRTYQISPKTGSGSVHVPAGPSVAVHNGIFYFAAVDVSQGDEVHYFDPTKSSVVNITGTIFQDLNSDGMRQSDEPIVPQYKVAANGDGYRRWVFSEKDGSYRITVPDGTELSIIPATTDCFEPGQTTGPIKFPLATSDSSVRNLPLVLKSNAFSLTPHLASGPARCSFTVPFWLTVTNDGCQTTPDGTVTLQLHKEAELIAADTEPTTTTDEGRLSWPLPPLAPGTNYQIKLQLKMPDEDLAGQEIPLPVTTSFTAADGAEVANTFTYDDVLRCAIDPNDKRSFPRRAEPTGAGYVQFDETITYMIRFQNTGNDTAFTVRLEDQLSDSLDYATFKPLTSSHDYEVTLTEEGMLKVLYPNILLVDSTTNEPGSHGFFTFSIQAKEGLADFDEITNTAGIFFDFNRPVITNQTKNTFVTALDADGDGYMFFVDCDDTNAAVNPGMADIPNNGIDEDCDGADLSTSVTTFSSRVLRLAPNPTQDRVRIELADDGSYGYVLYDARGQRVGQGSFRGREAKVELGQLASGVYLLQLTDARGGSVTRRVVRY